MKTLFEFLACLSAYFVLCCALALVVNIRGRKLVPTPYEWLTTMSAIVWKNEEQIKSQYFKTKRMKMHFYSSIFTYDARALEKEKLIEKRKIPKSFRRFEYHLTPLGEKKREEDREKRLH